MDPSRSNSEAALARRHWVALEEAENVVAELAVEFPNDVSLRRCRKELRDLASKAEARHLDYTVRLAQEAGQALG